jgi:hypothetical protein
MQSSQWLEIYYVSNESFMLKVITQVEKEAYTDIVYSSLRLFHQCKARWKGKRWKTITRFSHMLMTAQISLISPCYSYLLLSAVVLNAYICTRHFMHFLWIHHYYVNYLQMTEIGIITSRSCREKLRSSSMKSPLLSVA